jgi:signal peptide peptidase SppA
VNVKGINTPRLDEYFGLWAIEPARGMAMLEQAARMDLATHVRETPTPRLRDAIRAMLSHRVPAPTALDDDDFGTGEEEPDPGYTTVNGIAVVPVTGTLMKQCSSLGGATSTVALQAVMRQLAADPTVQGIVLTFDSPGGSVAGTADAGEAIAAAAAAKPVLGHVQDLCASAAYWLASQCTELYVNNGTALIGSIGTIVATYDSSKAAEKEGIQAKVYATGPLKGAGFPGTQITPEQDAYFQGIVNQTQQFFTAAVAAGRDLSIESVSKLATGGVYMASEALDAGLVDGLKTFDQVLARMGELIAARGVPTPGPGTPAGQNMEVRMANENTITQAAGNTSNTPATPPTDTRAELKRFTEAFGAANGAAWYVEGKSFEEATALHNQQTAAAIVELKRENTLLRAENDQLQARVKDLRGAAAPVSADVKPDPDAAKAAAGRDPTSMENRLGSNIARAARGFTLPGKSNN